MGSIFLTFFELLLYIFHKPVGFVIKDINAHQATWTYLLEQKYVNFITLDLYTIHEKRHLLDVKRVLEKTYTIWFFLVAGSFIGLIFFRKNLKQVLKLVTIIALILNGVLLLLSISFRYIFDLFHALLFKEDTWIFAKSSTLIELFPLIYFQQFFFIFLGLSTMLFTTIFFLSNSRHSKATS